MIWVLGRETIRSTRSLFDELTDLLRCEAFGIDCEAPSEIVIGQDQLFNVRV